MRWFFGRLAISIFGIAGVLAAPLAAQEDAGQKVYKQGLKAATFIISPRGDDRVAVGTGSLIDAQKRLVLTNEHVVGNAKEVMVLFALFEKNKLVNEKDKYFKQVEEGMYIKGKVLHKEVARDLAVIQLESLPTGALPVKFSADSPGTGATVHSIGNPGASDALWIYTPGKVRSVYKKTWVAGKEMTEHKATIIESTSPTSPGDSGGPLFNDKGEQIGVTQGGIVDASAQGYSYFIDVTEVKAFLKQHKITVSSAPPTAVVSETADPAKKTPVKTALTDSEKDEKNANSMLLLTKSLASIPDKKAVAVERLQELIQKYPKTKAAGEAEELLKKLQK